VTRGNHERWRRHSVFTQVRRVSIPQRAPQLNCSTTACAGEEEACAGAPWLTPGAVREGSPGFRPAHEMAARRVQLPRSHPGAKSRGAGCPTDREFCQDPPKVTRHPFGQPSFRDLRDLRDLRKLRTLRDLRDLRDLRGLRTRRRGVRTRCGPRVRWMRLPRGEDGRRQSAASAAAATAAAPAGRPASAGRAAAAGVSAGRAGVSPAGPPAPAAAAARSGGRPRPATRRPPGTAPAGIGHQCPDQYDSDHRQDDAYEHGVTLLPFPPKRPPVGASLLREAVMPSPLMTQSRVEELQSFGAG
jgi:hypothetical protein